MKTTDQFNRLLQLFTAVAVATAPIHAVAQAPAVQASSAPTGVPTIIDVELRPDGLLIGQLVSSGGKPTPNTQVKLVTSDGVEASTKTNVDGGFAFKRVKGVVTIKSERASTVLRSWKPGLAPPNSAVAVLLVEGQDMARGQHYVGMGANTFVDRSKRLLANPLFVAGVIGTAVAIPVAIANDDSAS